MSKHTPGPWTVCNSSQLMFGRKHGTGTEPLGFVYGPSFPEWSDYGQRAIADTRLIAAAPELLEALRWYVENDDVAVMPGNDFWLDGKARAIAAIAKATGEQP